MAWSHPSRPPEIEALVRCLDRHGVDYVVTGSYAACLYGVDLQPGDLDIVPAADRENLQRLIQLIQDVEGWPQGPFGTWTQKPDGEWKWIARETSPEEIAAWSPDPGNVRSFDALLTSRFGNLDLVPWVTGTYEVLRPRATHHEVFDCTVWAAHIDEILARLTVPRRDKDQARVAALREIQRRR